MTEPASPFPTSAGAGAQRAERARARDLPADRRELPVTTGEPVGSRNLARILPMTLSPASIRNVMADLEQAGLIFAPHTSAGRLPTELGLRFFVDAMLELGDVGREEQERIEAQMRAAASGHTFESALAEASSLLSGISRGAGVVLTTKTNVQLKHIEFVRLDPARALVVLVSDDGSVENRLLDLPPGLPASALQEASNYLNARLQGRTLGGLRAEIEAGRQAMKRELDAITERLVDAGLAVAVGPSEARQLIVRGQANLLDDLRAAEDLERIRLLFDDLETQKDVIDLLARAEGGEGVRIFIGSENKLFSLSGSSMIAAPVPRRLAEDRRRGRRHRPDAAELRPHRADGRLHRAGGLRAPRPQALSGTREGAEPKPRPRWAGIASRSCSGISRGSRRRSRRCRDRR